jgi:hypothetical protein
MRPFVRATSFLRGHPISMQVTVRRFSVLLATRLLRDRSTCAYGLADRPERFGPELHSRWRPATCRPVIMLWNSLMAVGTSAASASSFPLSLPRLAPALLSFSGRADTKSNRLGTAEREASGLPNARVAFPLDVGHLAWRNISFERTEAADGGFPSLQGNFVVARRQRHPKSALVIRDERGHLAIILFHRKSGVGQRY